MNPSHAVISKINKSTAKCTTNTYQQLNSSTAQQFNSSTAQQLNSSTVQHINSSTNWQINKSSYVVKSDYFKNPQINSKTRYWYSEAQNKLWIKSTNQQQNVLLILSDLTKDKINKSTVFCNQFLRIFGSFTWCNFKNQQINSKTHY